MVKIEPLEPQLPTKFEFLEYLDDYYNLDDIQNETLNDFLNENLEVYQSRELSRSIFEEYFNGDWRLGHQIRKVVITQRLYQISPNSKQA